MTTLSNGNLIFDSGKEMLDEVLCGTDLYNEESGLYVFLYNDNGDIASYNLYPQEVEKLREDQKNTGDSWSAFFGVGGYIYENEDAENLYWCEDNFSGEWEMV